MNHLGLTVFAGKIPGIILDFDKESKEYTIEFTDGRVVRTSVVNWESGIPADPEVAKYRLANRISGEFLYFDEDGWDVVSREKTAADYWETGAEHTITHGEDDDEDLMRSDIDGNSVLRHVEKELYNNTKDEEGNPEQDFIDDADEITQFPPAPADVERFMERAETAEPDPMKTDREFPSGEYNERKRTPQHSHVREQAAWEDKHYANNPVCEDCGDPLVNGHCYSCLDKKKGVSPEDYGKEEQETIIRQATIKKSFLPALAALAAPIAEAIGIGGAAAAEGAAGSGTLGTIGRMAGRALSAQGAMPGMGGGDDTAVAAPEYQSIALSTTQPSEGIYAIEIDGVDSHPENGGTGNYNDTHGDGPEYLKDVNDDGGALSVIRRFTEEDNIESALEEALGIIASGLPMVIEFSEKDESGADDESIKAFDELFEEVFGEEYTSARDEEKGGKKESKVAADQQDTVICRKCNRTAIVGQNACSNVPALPDCPIVSVQRLNQDQYPAVTQQQGQQQAPTAAPTSTVPQTLNFPVYPKITKALKISARKPKMCPYHTDLVDYSVALNDPGSALSALSQHQYSQNSCKGGWGEQEGTKCRFKPEMIHSEYWEQKDREAEERKLERERQKAEEEALLMQEVTEENLLDPVAEEVEEPTTVPEFEEESVDEVVDTEMTNISEDIPPYNDYIAPENYSFDATDNGSYQSEQQEPVYASRNWLREAADDEAEDGIRVYEYPGDEDYEDGSADGSQIEDTDGNALVEGEVYRVGPAGELPDVVKVVSVDPQYVEVERIDSTFSEDAGGRPYRLSLKDIMVQDIEIEKVDSQLNPNEIGADSADALSGTPETMDDAGPGHNDLPGTTDLSSGRKAATDVVSVNKEMKRFFNVLERSGIGVSVEYGGKHPRTVFTHPRTGKTVTVPVSSTPANPQAAKSETKKYLRQGIARLNEEAIASGQMTREDADQFLLTVDGVLKSARKDKVAGYDYSMNQQKQFINEGGTARNLEKLDLSGTHYPDEAGFSDDDYFLWG